MNFVKLAFCVYTEDNDGGYAVLPWKADTAQIKQWLLKNGYPK